MDGFVVRPTRVGEGVFAARTHASGDRLMLVRGERLHRSQLPPIGVPEDDRFVQVGREEYLGPSGDLDDLVNHSCDPNAGLAFCDDGIWVVAIRDIPAGAEVAWDYSTTMDEDDWEIDCACGASACRGRIRDFKHLPDETQARYVALGIVPEYVR